MLASTAIPQSTASGSILDVRDANKAGNSTAVVLMKNTDKGTVIKVDQICVYLVTDATVQSRYVKIYYKDIAGLVHWAITSGAAMPASATYFVSFTINCPIQNVSGSGQTYPLPDTYLQYQDYVTAEIVAGVAGDTWTVRARGRPFKVRQSV